MMHCFAFSLFRAFNNICCAHFWVAANSFSLLGVIVFFLFPSRKSHQFCVFNVSGIKMGVEGGEGE